MAHSLALQWSLDETTDHFLRVGRNLIRAATIDNVQPLAILACEQFGATLAISPMTRLKVEKLIRSQTSSMAITFLKATVGFANGGTILELSKNIAGVNFMALAAALISVTNTFNAATAIQTMIMDSATDKTLVPNAYHLKDLLDILEPQLNRVGFLTDLLAWRDWWTRHTSLSDEARQCLKEFGGMIPTAEGIINVVAALREVSRIGEAKTVNITVGEAAPWLTAFTRWCLGDSPAIYGDTGQCLLDQPRHPVKVIYSPQITAGSPAGEAIEYEMRIDILSAFSDFTEIITSNQGGNHRYAAGMVDIQSHARSVLSVGGMDDKLRYTSLVQALPYALDHIRRSCQTKTGDPSDSTALAMKNVYGSNAFPRDTVIAGVMKRYLSLEDGIKLQQLPPDCWVVDVPEVCAYMKDLDQATASNERKYQLKIISEVTADILALSLFDGCLDSLVVYHDTEGTSRSDQGFAKWINAILLGSTDTPTEGSYTELILSWALDLVHHDVAICLRAKEWACSSSHGQVVFPKLYERQVLQQNGCLELFALPGVLTLPDRGIKTFTLVKSIQQWEMESNSEIFKRQLNYRGSITRAMNLYPKEKLLWRIQELGDCLSVGMGWSRNSRRIGPFYLLENVASAIFMSPCSHTESDSFDAEPNFELKEPSIGIHKANTWETDPEGSKVQMYPVAGDPGLRMLALATVFVRKSPVSAVICNDTCLECLHKQCMISKRPIAIL